MLAYLERLSEREKKLVVVGSVLTVLLLVYAFIWHPYSSYIARLQERVANQQSLLSWMEPVTQQILSLRAQVEISASSSSTQPVLTLVDEFRSKSQLQNIAMDLSQYNDKLVKISIKTVPFDQLIAWLLTLSEQQHVQVVEADMQKKDIDGLVSADIILQ